MALCERLEVARTERETTRNRLTAATLARLNAPGSNTVTFRNRAIFSLENLTPLTTRPDQISTLRQTILELATRGKLVPARKPSLAANGGDFLLNLTVNPWGSFV